MVDLTKAKRIACRMRQYKDKKAAGHRWCVAVKAALTGVTGSRG